MEEYVVLVRIWTRGYDTMGLVLADCYVVGPYTEELANLYAKKLNTAQCRPGRGVSAAVVKLPYKPDLPSWGRLGISIS